MPEDRLDIHLRMLTADDAGWMVALDRAGYGGVRRFGWRDAELRAELADGVWASDDRVGWAVMVDGEPGGVAFVRDLRSGDGNLSIRLSKDLRGRGVGREVLRQLADHHFKDDPALRRLEGRTHEGNVPMQRAFNAAGFRMEARYRDTIEDEDGTLAAEWGYAVTRADWEAGRHRVDDNGYDLHGLTFALEADPSSPVEMDRGSVAKFLQEGHRVLVRYEGGRVYDGEAAGILERDAFRYRYLHRYGDHRTVTGWGSSRVQRRGDGRLEIIDEFELDDGRSGRHVWVERR